MQESSLILLSGGLDSTLALLFALDQSQVKFALSFDYGQQSATKEINAAQQLCKLYNIEHKIISLPFFSQIINHPFFDHSAKMPKPEIDELDQMDIVTKSAKTVWVPNRNGMFINTAASLAESAGIKRIYVGFNAEEAATFPDNSLDYLNAVNAALKFSTLNQVTVHSPTIAMHKKEILQKLLQKKFPLELLWSCYQNFAKMCGDCESCKRLKRAMGENGVNDKTFFLK